MDSIKTRAEKTFALSLASMLNTVLSIVLSMVFARILTKGELAAYRQTFLAYETVAPFLSLGISSGLNYILVRNSNRKRGIVNASIVILTVMGIAYALFIAFGGNNLLATRFNNQMVSGLLLWMIPYAIFVIPSGIANNVMVHEGRIKLCSSFSVFSKLAHSVMVITVVIIFQNAISAVIGNVVVSIAVSIITMFVIYRYVVPKDDNKFYVNDIGYIIKFSLPLGIATMIGTLDSLLDRFIVSSLMSAEEFAVYSTGAQELPLIGTITGALTTVVAVDIAVCLKENRYDDTLQLFKNIAKTTTLFLFPIALFCFACAKDIITVLYTDAYLDAVDVFRIYLLRVPVSTVVYAPLLIGLGQSKKVLQRSVISLLANAVISYILVKNFGAYGAALGTIIVCYTILIPFNLRAISKGMNKKWTELLPFKHYLKVTVSLVPTIFISVLVRYIFANYIKHSLTLLCVCGIVFCVSVVVTYRLVFKIDAIKIVIKFIKSKINSKKV